MGKIILIGLLLVCSCAHKEDYSYKYKIGDIVCVLNVRGKIVDRVGGAYPNPEYKIIYTTNIGEIKKRWIEESIINDCE
jgi:hypothetical protein